MPGKEKISIRQFTILVILMTMGDSILVLPSIVALQAKQDAWISSFIGLMVGLLSVYIFSMVANLYPQLTLIQSIQKILGTWLGNIVSLLFLIYPFLGSVAFIREVGDFITTGFLQGSPIEAIHILYVALVIMAVRLGLEVMGRMGELAIPWVFLVSFILFISVSPKIEFSKIQPFVENGIRPILHGSIACIAFPFLELVVLLMIIPSVNKPQKIQKSFLQGALIGGGVVFILILMCILVIGADLVQLLIYPTYNLAKRINIGGFFERVEAMITLMWILTLFMKVSIYFYVFNIGLAQLLKLKEYRMLSLPTGLIMIVFSTLIAPNIVYYNQVISQYWPYFDMTYGFILPLLLLGVYYLRKLFMSQIQT